MWNFTQPWDLFICETESSIFGTFFQLKSFDIAAFLDMIIDIESVGYGQQKKSKQKHMEPP